MYRHNTEGFAHIDVRPLDVERLSTAASTFGVGIHKDKLRFEVSFLNVVHLRTEHRQQRLVVDGNFGTCTSSAQAKHDTRQGQRTACLDDLVELADLICQFKRVTHAITATTLNAETKGL